VFVIRGARLIKLLTIWYNIVIFSQAFTQFDLTGDCQQTRVELCACTSDHECSTRAGEACTSDRQPVNGNAASGLVSM